jgi:hypothetical protein
VAAPREVRRWLRRIVLLLLGSAAILAALAFVFGWVEHVRNADEEYIVYSAYLSDGVLGDAHDWSVGPSIQVVIEDTTRIGANLRWWGLYALDGRASFDHLSAMTRVSFIARNFFQTRLRSKFRLPSRATPILASISEIESADFENRFPNNVGYIVLSGVGFNEDRTEAVFYIDHFCGLCGGGRYVWMEKVGRLWKVRAERYTWMS